MCLLGIERKNENKLISYVKMGKFLNSKVVLDYNEAFIKTLKHKNNYVHMN